MVRSGTDPEPGTRGLSRGVLAVRAEHEGAGGFSLEMPRNA